MKVYYTGSIEFSDLFHTFGEIEWVPLIKDRDSISTWKRYHKQVLIACGIEAQRRLGLASKDDFTWHERRVGYWRPNVTRIGLLPRLDIMSSLLLPDCNLFVKNAFASTFEDSE